MPERFILLNLHFVKEGTVQRTYSRVLHRLQDHRHQADYTLMAYDAQAADSYVRQASEVVQHISSVLDPS